MVSRVETPESTSTVDIPLSMPEITSVSIRSPTMTASAEWQCSILRPVRIISDFPDVTGVFHCFSGSYEMAKELVKRGWYIGFTGVVTFKNARKAVEVAEKIPLDRILIETDCPYMAPEPFRGRRNDPSLVPFVAKKIAELRGISAEAAAAATAENARRLFRI